MPRKFSDATVLNLAHVNDLRKAGKLDEAHRFYASLTEAQRRECEALTKHLNSLEWAAN